MINTTAAQPLDLDRNTIREIFMRHGFTIKDGQTDLKSYVYEAAEALIAQARTARPKREMPPEMKAAIEEAHKTGATGALLPDGSAVFINYGHDYGDNDHLCCTACGGSGHIEDQQARAARLDTTASASENAQAAFEAWAKSHGGLPLDRAGDHLKTDDGLLHFPTYKFGRTEIAWRAWANRRATQPVQTGAAVDEVTQLRADKALLMHLRDAVGKLVKAKGRFHTEQNYGALVAAYDLTKPVAALAPVAAQQAAAEQHNAVECVSALRAAPAGAYAQPLPIASAPHDGTEVLAWSKTGKTWHQVYWKTQEHGDWAWVPPFHPRWACRWNDAYSQGQNEFSHWLPIPATPGELIAASRCRAEGGVTSNNESSDRAAKAPAAQADNWNAAIDAAAKLMDPYDEEETLGAMNAARIRELKRAASPASTPEASQQAAAVAAPSVWRGALEAIANTGMDARQCMETASRALSTAAAATTSEDARECNGAALGVLADIFGNTERPDKIAVSLDHAGHHLTIRYEDLDEEWFREIDHAMRATQQEGGK